MARDPRFDILFEPVRIGPVTARNRFYQVPHASSTGADMPNTRKGLRAIRAEGGWGVVCTGYCSTHPTSDDAPPSLLPAHQPPQRRVRGLAREPRAPAARNGRRHQGGGGRHLRGGGALFGRRADGRARHAVARRRARGVRAGRGAAGSPGSQDLRGAGQLECALLRGGLPGALRRVREADDLKAGGGRRAIHVARRHGVAGKAWRARSHRRGPPFHLGPLPAEKDRGGEGRRHPRVHRLQHLLLVLPRVGPDPLHPEPHDARAGRPRSATYVRSRCPRRSAVES